MSEKLFRFLLSELKHVRIRCMACKKVAEMPIGDIRSSPAKCHFCNADFAAPEKSKLLADFGVALNNVLMERDRVEVEFCIPESDKP